jgi:hypothetical protein
MSITISLPSETEKNLRRRAAVTGLAPDALARQLFELALNGGGQVALSVDRRAARDEILAPFRKEVAETGMADEELAAFFTEVCDEVRAEKRARQAQE